MANVSADTSNRRYSLTKRLKEEPMKKSLVIVSLIAASTLSACVVAPAPRPYYGDRVMVAPPAPRVEYVGPPPVVGHIWIDGFWNWTGSRHEWVPGRWEAPRPGYRWVPHRWENNGDHWRQSGGQWEEHREHDHEREHEHDHRDWR